jgi:DNA-binding LacI/PurR family transcriptional regulator
MNPPEPSSAGNPPRVTMRMLAQTAGVSAQAVSLALRNHPSIPAQTRRRIQKVAERAGYLPDPHVAKLMHHLRVSRRQVTSANVCALTTRPPGVREVFCDLLLAGAKAAAERAGFHLEPIHLGGSDVLFGQSLRRILRSRGVEGVLLVPMAELCTLDDLLDWSEFAVVSATLSVASPRFDSVAVNHFKNVFTLCERLRDAGFRRPGLVIHPEHDARCGRLITAAHAWHGIYGDLKPVPAFVAQSLERPALKCWLEREDPDVLLAEHDGLALELQKERAVIARRPIVSCSARPGKGGAFPFPGINDLPWQVGATGLEILARKVMLGQHGIPDHPCTTLVDGCWVGPVPKPNAGA